MNQERQIKTTGDLRELLANTIMGVANKEIPIAEAMAIHKLSKNIVESLYSETKIAIFHSEIKQDVESMGDLPIGNSKP
jgi:hypothetical protein